jgi:flagellar biosynthesis/type III secretory pathway protein FliH
VGSQAQRNDWHVPARDLFVKSTFAHGYIHGYEQGFHNGDIDLQMGREFRDAKSQIEYKKPVGYRNEFGEKKIFEDGYRDGFLVGYTDCFSGRSFRAVQLLEASHPVSSPTKIHFDRNFDRAFRDGYETGQRQGLADGRVSAAFRVDASVCEPGPHGEMTPETCEAFRSGYRLGYSDGFANQHETSAVFARARSK